MTIRDYQPSDCEEIAELFYHTVHTVNAKDYSQEQLNAWANGQINLKEWNRTMQAHYSIVAVENKVIAGFGSIDKAGYLSHLFVHADYQRKKIATAICNRLEQVVSGNITTHASITAKPFFEKRGYQMVKRRQVERQGITLKNFLMEKRKSNPAGQCP